jgi:hypothetical protein
VALLKRRRLIALIGAIVVVRSFVLYAGPITEPQAKASLLFNLAAFVEWPPGALAAGDRLSICVAGDADVLLALRPFEGRAIDGHAIAS